MTQIIAAICENGRKAIVLADRLVSTEGEDYEGECKLWELPRNSLYVPAGNMNNARTIYGEVHRTLLDDVEQNLSHQATKIAEEYSKLRLKEPKATYDSLPENWDEIQRDAELDPEIILTGFDDDRKPHIWIIRNPGIAQEEEAFFCLGIAADHASRIFAQGFPRSARGEWRSYRRSTNLSDAIFTAFRAKRASEISSDVGESTDMAVISSDGIQYVKLETIDQYAARYRELDEKVRKHANEAYEQVRGIEIEFQDKPNELDEPDERGEPD